ncbi:hypothetical protein CO121_01715 [bacterium (Candidatus Gribaldobacteria) CG_4_9_14_3_um_filter_36_15]|uniref:Uncharacterized protein n=1 Tax=bacterium (Candidatus Gribaldobacteria) CG_4_9_14_3_um_filter_36_15 TaxID=2014269 RepID=A0A2M7ZUV1_9BACT|nr:MAG: hypothetical protein CO121_01715 [bacterium (Candidatus Gribaldobacteria) CG_4_9_14_3_um_filter_36_15]
MFSIVGLLYFLEGLITFGVAYKLFKSFQKSKNYITRNFAFLFFFFTPTFFCWGLPSLVAPGNSLLLNIGSIAGEIFIFIGFAFGMRSFVATSVATKFPQLSQNIISLATLLIGSVIVFLNVSVFGSSQLNPQGVIEWNLHPAAIVIYVTLILSLTFPLGIEFFRLSIVNPETRARSILLGVVSFLAGFGGALVIMNIPWPILMVGHILLSLGIVCMGWAIFFTEKT